MRVYIYIYNYVYILHKHIYNVRLYIYNYVCILHKRIGVCVCVDVCVYTVELFNLCACMYVM